MPDDLSIQFIPAVGARTFLLEQESDYDWLVPGLFERGDRVIFTGGEGKGKSTLMRQMAIQISLGIHPFTLEAIGARSVLFIDLENSRKQIRRALTKIVGEYELEDQMLQIATWPSGVDLTDPRQQLAFTKIMNDTLPDVVFIGPMYKMAPHLETEEQSSKLSSFLDMIRSQYNVCLVMESHQPHQVVADGRRYRPERPFGSSLWLRWPEFGICIEDDGTLRHWRGARDADREWPIKLRKHGDEWPWELDSRKCFVCDARLEDQQEKYCSPTCRNVGKQRDFRARARVR